MKNWFLYGIDRVSTLTLMLITIVNYEELYYVIAAESPQFQFHFY